LLDNEGPQLVIYVRVGREANVLFDGGAIVKRDYATLAVSSREFESPWLHQGDVAHSGERCVRIAEVRGSSPLISTRSGPIEPKWRNGRRATFRA
jgi:hypothetical protein